ARGEASAEAARADGLEAENARLSALLSLDGPAAADGLVARVESVGGGGAGETLALDRGSEAGLRVGMPVVAAGGLVGRVVEVGRRSCTVLPLTAGPSAVGVRVGASGAAVRAGDVAVTAGLRHSVFPAGLAVGRVAGGPGHFVVEAFAPPARLEVVKVLRWTPEP